MAARNRVIYQSEALFVTKQYSGSNTVDIVDGGVVGSEKQSNLSK